MADDVLSQIAAWATRRHTFSDKARLLARHAILDTIGCIVAGGGHAAVAAVRSAQDLWGRSSGPSRIIGGGGATPSVAALVNGMAAHVLDFDDNFNPAITHASAVLVPALLAIADARGTTGRELVDSYLVGLAAQAAIGRGVNPAHYRLGWHSTSTVGLIGTAAATARLMALDHEATTAAMSLAVSMAAGCKGQFGTSAKPLHAGIAARNAVQAAELAACGISGRADILEHSQGFLGLYHQGEQGGWPDLRRSLPVEDEPHVIETDGLLPKRHPSCGSTHNVVDAVLDLRRQFNFRAEDVRFINAKIGTANLANLPYENPVTEMEARFSMQYCVAVALVSDHLRLADFTATAIQREEIRALLALTQVTAHTADAEARAYPAQLPHEVIITLRDDTTYMASRELAKGSIQEPFTDTERHGKFRDCCDRLDASATQQLLDVIERLDELNDLGGLQPAFG